METVLKDAEHDSEYCERIVLRLNGVDLICHGHAPHHRHKPGACTKVVLCRS